MPTTHTSDLSRTIILQGCPIGVALGITFDGTNGVTIQNPNPDVARATGKRRFLFDTLQQIAYKLIKAGSSTTSGSFYQIGFSNNLTVEFVKDAKTIDGIDESVKSSGTTATGSGLAEITYTASGGDIDSPNYATFTTELDASETDYFLCIFPNGFTYDSNGKATPDGWCYMLGRRSSNIEVTQGNANGTLAITYAAETAPQTWDSVSGKTFGDAVKALAWGSGILVKPSTDGVAIIAPTLVDADVTVLKAGKMVVKASTISY